MLNGLLFKLIISLLIGAAVGLERQSSGQDDESGGVGGIRTFSLVCLLGALAGVFYIQNFIIIFVLIASVVSILLLIYYAMGVRLTKSTGLTTEISFLYTFILGFLMATEILPIQLVIAIFVILVLVLALKSKTKKLIAGISQGEIESFISYAIIALVILPFLPDKGIYLNQIPLIPDILGGYNISLGQFATLELFNPRTLWFIVVLVTGIDVFGYILGKLVGNKRGFTMASFVGGFISSTSTTQSLAQRSKKSTVINYLVGAALLANLASFFQIFLLTGPLNPRLLIVFIPTLFVIIIAASILSFFFLKRKEKQTKQEKVEKRSDKIFSLVPALKFAVLIICVKLVTKVCLVLFGQSGFIVSSIIASFAGIDAIVINLAGMAGSIITFKTALLTLVLVNATNLISKSVYSFLQGNRKFAFRFLVSVIIIIIVSFAGLFFIGT